MMKSEPYSQLGKPDTPFERFQELAESLLAAPKKEVDEKANGKQKEHSRKKARKVKPS